MRKGLTLIETMVIIALLAVVAVVAGPPSIRLYRDIQADKALKAMDKTSQLAAITTPDESYTEINFGIVGAVVTVDEADKICCSKTGASNKCCTIILNGSTEPTYMGVCGNVLRPGDVVPAACRTFPKGTVVVFGRITLQR